MRKTYGPTAIMKVATKLYGDSDRFMDELDKIPTRKRNGKQPPPEGGISIRAAERKYRVACQTISRWVQRGLIPVIIRQENYTYIDEGTLADVVANYKKAPGRGKRTAIASN